MLIGISGIAGAGKDTCADFLVASGGFAKVALADPIKRAVRDIFAFTDDQLWGPSKMRNAPDERYPRAHTWGAFSKDGLYATCTCCNVTWRRDGGPASQCYLTPRYTLQQLGTEWGRHLYPNVWIEYALRVAATLAEGGYAYYATTGLMADGGPSFPPASVVVPDVRFKNEIAAFRKAGARLIRVRRPVAGLGGSSGQHVSETEQEAIPDELFDVVIVNDGTLEELEAKVCGFVEAIRNE